MRRQQPISPVKQPDANNQDNDRPGDAPLPSAFGPLQKWGYDVESEQDQPGREAS